MGLRCSPIIPKKFTSAKNARKSVDTLLLSAKEEAFKRLQKYPAWQPWKNPPRTGLRAGGKRTGNLGRGWGSYTLRSGESIEMVNNTEYAPYVQGTKDQQARALARRGWPRVDEVGEESVKAALSKWKPEA